MLLTSSQVSFVISSIIVFLFTTALFLSGYVLQQQTVRDLRAAIKPQLVRPLGGDLFVQPQVKENGYLVDTVMIDAQQLGKAIREEGERGDMIGATRWQKARKEKERQRKIEVEGTKQTVVEGEGDEVVEKSGGEKRKGQGNGKGKEKGKEAQVSRAERRKRIKEQILADGNGEEFKGYRRRMW